MTYNVYALAVMDLGFSDWGGRGGAQVKNISDKPHKSISSLSGGTYSVSKTEIVHICLTLVCTKGIEDLFSKEGHMPPVPPPLPPSWILSGDLLSPGVSSSYH